MSVENIMACLMMIVLEHVSACEEVAQEFFLHSEFLAQLHRGKAKLCIGHSATSLLYEEQ